MAVYPFEDDTELPAASLNALPRVLALGAVLAGSPPSVADGGFLLMSGSVTVTFTSGVGTLTFPTPFPGGLVSCNPYTSATGTNVPSLTLLGGGTFSRSAVQVNLVYNGSLFNGTVDQVYFEALGF